MNVRQKWAGALGPAEQAITSSGGTGNLLLLACGNATILLLDQANLRDSGSRDGFCNSLNPCGVRASTVRLVRLETDS